MPEFYKRVTATQFKMTSEEKTSVAKGGNVSFEGQAVKYIGGERYHVLIPVADRLMPLSEGGWIVRNPEIELYSDPDFKAKFIATSGNYASPAPAVVKPPVPSVPPAVDLTPTPPAATKPSKAT